MSKEKYDEKFAAYAAALLRCESDQKKADIDQKEAGDRYNKAVRASIEAHDAIRPLMKPGVAYIHNGTVFILFGDGIRTYPMGAVQ